MIIPIALRFAIPRKKPPFLFIWPTVCHPERPPAWEPPQFLHFAESSSLGAAPRQAHRMCSLVGHRRGQNLSARRNLCIRAGPLPARRGGLYRRPPRRSAWMPGGLFVLPLVFRFAAPGPHTGSPPCGQKKREEKRRGRVNSAAGPGRARKSIKINSLNP